MAILEDPAHINTTDMVLFENAILAAAKLAVTDTDAEPDIAALEAAETVLTLDTRQVNRKQLIADTAVESGCKLDKHRCHTSSLFVLLQRAEARHIVDKLVTEVQAAGGKVVNCTHGWRGDESSMQIRTEEFDSLLKPKLLASSDNDALAPLCNSLMKTNVDFAGGVAKVFQHTWVPFFVNGGFDWLPIFETTEIK